MTRTILLLVLLLVIAGGGGWWYFFSSSGSTLAQVGGSEGFVPAAGERLNPNIPTTLFSDPRFTELKVYGKVPVEPGVVGRENPFASIFPKTAVTEEASEVSPSDVGF